MDDFWNIIGVLSIVIYLLGFVVYRQQKRILNLIAMKTYTEPSDCEVILSSFWNRIFISKRARMMMLLEPAIVINDESKVEKYYRELMSMNLNDFNKIGINQKMLTYYVLREDIKNSESIYKELNELLSHKEFAKDPGYASIKKEADQLIEVYIRRNLKFLPKVLKAAESSQSRAHKSTYYFRAAILQYFNGEIDHANALCLESKKYCHGSELEKRIDSILAGNLDAFYEVSPERN